MEAVDPNTICEECLKKTKIHYEGNNAYFQPKLRSITDLKFGASKLIDNYLILILESLYRQYMRIRNWFQRVNAWLFPRPSTVWCHHADSSLVGQLHYADRDQLNVPIHNLTVEFWGRTWWLQWRKLGEAYSNDEGVFILPFELRQARNRAIVRTQFEVYQTTHVYYNDEQPKPVLTRCYVEVVPISNLTGMRYNLRTIHLSLWAYRKDSRVPRTEIRNITNDSPQYYVQGRIDALQEQMIPIEVIKRTHLAKIAYAPETISLADIQRDYPENLTVCIEKKLPGYTRGDEWFGKRMMNGMNRGYFLPDKNQPDHYWIHYFGAYSYDSDEQYALPTVGIQFRLKADGLPTPVEICITGPTNAFDKDPWQQKIFTPASGDEWLYAKRVARVNGAFSTEVDEHFTATHLNTEQYAIAAYRNFRRSPLSCLLLPHLKEVALINHTADELLIHGFIPSATALTEAGLHQRNRDILGMQDWKGWSPMTALSQAHTCARAEALFYRIVVDYVDAFFADNADEIRQHWIEVFRFSEDLVHHAVPVFLSDADWSSFSPNERKWQQSRLEYYSQQYSFDLSAQRETIGGELKAISPITKARRADESGPEDWANLKKACAYIIMTATYLHTWINEHQYDDLGEILYSSGGLRYGDKERGILAPESDLSISPDLTRSTQTLWFTNLLSRTEYGFITRDEEHDINPIFRRMLLEKKEEFARLGVDIHTIESRTNI